MSDIDQPESAETLLLAEIEQAKLSLQSWLQRERIAHEQVLLGRGYLQAIERACQILEMSKKLD